MKRPDSGCLKSRALPAACALVPGRILFRRSRGSRSARRIRRHPLAIVFHERLQIAMTETGVEIVVLHFGVNLIVIPVVHVEAIDRADNSGAVTATRAMREEDSG